jgi:phenylacetate-CoA ligase
MLAKLVYDAWHDFTERDFREKLTLNNWRRPLDQLYDTYIKPKPIHDYVAMLRDFYSLPAEEQHRVQEERLAELLRHAALRVPYYREVLAKAGVFSNGAIDLSRFRHIPFLTRDTLQSQFDQLKSDDLHSRRWYKNRSGGSTGEPVVFIQDSLYGYFNSATKMVQYEWAGKRVGEPHVKLWGSDRDILQESLGLRTKLGNFFRNLVLLNSFHMSEEDMTRYAHVIQKTRPALLEAYAESAYELARFVNKHDLRLAGVGAVVTCAGTLYPFMRQEIQEAFNCPVFNRYGSREVGDMAGETRSHADLSVFTYTHLIEVINENGEPCKVGEEGKVVVTNLTNYAMPFIRYQIGDRAVVGETAGHLVCSAHTLKNVTGRLTDCFVREDGSTVPGAFFIHFLGVVYNAGWLRKTQIIQQDYNAITIKLVVYERPPESSLAEIREAIRQVMGPKCEIEFEFVESIPSPASGKYRYTISHVHRS